MHIQDFLLIIPSLVDTFNINNGNKCSPSNNKKQLKFNFATKLVIIFERLRKKIRFASSIVYYY